MSLLTTQHRPAMFKDDTAITRLGAPLLQKLMSNERVVGAVQSAITRGLRVKEKFDAAVRGTLTSLDIPSSTEVERLREKVYELEKTVSRLSTPAAKRAARK